MIQITENAARQIHKMLDKRALGESGLRLGVKAGGCSGFEYVFGWDVTRRPDEPVCETPHGATF